MMPTVLYYTLYHQSIDKYYPCALAASSDQNSTCKKSSLNIFLKCTGLRNKLFTIGECNSSNFLYLLDFLLT